MLSPSATPNNLGDCIEDTVAVELVNRGLTRIGPPLSS
jgi:hypothetical protein